MKKGIQLIRKATYLTVAILLLGGCQNLDTPPFGDYELDPGVVTIISPAEGAAIKVFEEVTSLDIEIDRVTVR
jgi:hypothetical protein